MNNAQKPLLLLFLIIGAYLQLSMGRIEAANSAQIALTPTLVLYCAIRGSAVFAIAMGLIGGALIDSISFAQFGVSSIPLALLGLGFQLRKDALGLEHPISQVVFGFAGTAVYLFAAWGIDYGLQRSPAPFKTEFSPALLLTAAISGLLCPFVVRGLDLLTGKIPERPKRAKAKRHSVQVRIQRVSR